MEHEGFTKKADELIEPVLPQSDEENHDSCAHHGHHHELEIDGVGVSYRDIVALDGISMATSCGNRVALIGPNGAGKSTLLKSIAGLVPRDKGEIRWRGTSVKKWSHEFAYLPQREEVDWSFPITVRGLVEMGRYPQTGWWRKFSEDDQRAVDVALHALNLDGLQDRQIRELSGGQQQRAFLARSIAQEAHVLLLDEPFTGLDRNAALLLGELLAKLAEEGRLIIASHHELKSAHELFDEVLVLDTQQVAFGAVGEVLTDELIAKTFSVPV